MTYKPVGIDENGRLPQRARTAFANDIADPNTEIGAAQSASYGAWRHVTAYGADPTGVADSTAAIQAALDDQGAVIFPPGDYKVTSTLTVQAETNVHILPGARVFAGSAITGAIFKTSTAFVRTIAFTGGGVIDCAELADIGIHLYYFAHVRIQDLRIDAAKVYGIKLGDTGAAGRSAEAIIHGVHILRLTGSIPASNNFGIYVENSGDHSISQVVIQSYRTGVFMASGTSTLTDVHVWHDPARGEHHTSFDDNGSGNVYIGCYADTPSTYGFRMRQFNNRLVGCIVYLNTTYGSDNVVRGVRFEQTSPFATIHSMLFSGGDASHRIAVDIEVSGSDLSTVDIEGCVRNNVQTQNSLNRTRDRRVRDLTLLDKTTLPAASSSVRGQVNLIQGGSGVPDAAYICLKLADGTYSWIPVAPEGDPSGDNVVANFRDPFGANRVWDAANRAHFWRITGRGTVSKVRYKVGVQSGNISFAVYRNTGTGTSAAPGTQLAATGAIACPAVGDAETSLGSTIEVYPGDWIAMSCDNATASFLGGGVAGITTGSIFAGRGGYQSTAHPLPSTPALTGAGQSGAALLRLVP